MRAGRHGVALLAALLWIAASASLPASARTTPDIIGQIFTYTVEEEETLLDIARHFELGYLDVVAANPDVDPWLPGTGTTIILPTAFILPDAPRQGIVINLAEQRLYYFPGGSQPVQTYPLGVGRDGLETPLGQTRIVRKKVGPTWRPTPRMRKEDPTLPKVVPPGPDNPLGEYAMYLGWNAYLIHGTNKPWGVGRRVSSGCIRLYPEGIERLFPQISINTPVTVVDQPIKLGWLGSELFLEAHTSQSQADQLEQAGSFLYEDVPDLVMRVLQAVGKDADRLDWNAVHRAVHQRTGLPIQITKPRFRTARDSNQSRPSPEDLNPDAGLALDVIEQDFQARFGVVDREISESRGTTPGMAPDSSSRAMAGMTAAARERAAADGGSRGMRHLPMTSPEEMERSRPVRTPPHRAALAPIGGSQTGSSQAGRSQTGRSSGDDLLRSEEGIVTGRFPSSGPGSVGPASRDGASDPTVPGSPPSSSSAPPLYRPTRPSPAAPSAPASLGPAPDQGNDTGATSSSGSSSSADPLSRYDYRSDYRSYLPEASDAQSRALTGGVPLDRPDPLRLEYQPRSTRRSVSEFSPDAPLGSGAAGTTSLSPYRPQGDVDDNAAWQRYLRQNGQGFEDYLPGGARGRSEIEAIYDRYSIYGTDRR